MDRSKKYIKTIKIDMKIDAVDPQAAADKPPGVRRTLASLSGWIKGPVIHANNVEGVHADLSRRCLLGLPETVCPASN